MRDMAPEQALDPLRRRKDLRRRTARGYTSIVMPIRILIALALLLQQLALPAVASRTGDDTSDEASCCKLIETVTCCGDRVVERRCGKTGGACVCGVERDDESPIPAIPRSDQRGSPEIAFVAHAGNGFSPATASRACVRWTPLARHRAHNETQALLCIWRT